MFSSGIFVYVYGFVFQDTQSNLKATLARVDDTLEFQKSLVRADVLFTRNERCNVSASGRRAEDRLGQVVRLLTEVRQRLLRLRQP